MNAAERGVSLVEVLVAAILIGIAIIPLLQVLPGLLAEAQVADVDLRLAAAGTRKAEELTNRLRADITSAASGAEPCTDLPDCRLEWTVATELSSTTSGVGVLKTVAVIACQDGDADSVCDSTELQVRYDTKVTSRP